jgi:hypothetical protein
MRHSTGVYPVSRASIITRMAIVLVAMLLLPIFGVGIIGYFVFYGGF